MAAQQVRALAVLPEDPDSIPKTHMTDYNLELQSQENWYSLFANVVHRYIQVKHQYI